MAKKNFESFVSEYNGKWIDTDGAYGAQCVDGYHVYCNWLGIDSWSGNAIDLWHGASSKHPGCSKTITDWSALQPGDIVIWAQGPVYMLAPQGHVAMFRNWTGQPGGYATIFGENQGEGSNPDTGKAFSLFSVPRENFVGAYRPDNIIGSKTLWTLVLHNGLVVDAWVQQ